MEATAVSDAIDFAATLHGLYVERSAAYRIEYVNILLFYVSGTAAVLAFWLTLKRRRHLFAAPLLFFAVSSVLAIYVQLYWFQYNHTSWRLGEEYRQQAISLINGEDTEPFNTIACAITPALRTLYNIKEGDERKSISVKWATRKYWEVNRHWNNDVVKTDPDLGEKEREKIIACTPASARLYVGRQANIWTILVLLTGLGAVLIVWRTRNGTDDTNGATR